MASNRSQRALEQVFDGEGFATDFTIQTQTKMFAVHRCVIDQAMPEKNLWPVKVEMVIDVTAEVAEDFVRHSYGLQVPCLRRVVGSQPTMEQCVRVLDLSHTAALEYFDFLMRDCNDWLREVIQSTADEPELWVVICEKLLASVFLMDEMSEEYENLLEKLADSMQTILAGRKDLLQRITKCEKLHCGVLGALAARSETLKAFQKT